MARKKILIVEDDRDIVEMVEYNLQEEGYLTASALNGEDGVNLARSEQPDLIILDIMLPVMDGFEVCRALKSDGVTVFSRKSQRAVSRSTRQCALL